MTTNSISITGVNCQNFNDAFHDDESNMSINIAPCCCNTILNKNLRLKCAGKLGTGLHKIELKFDRYSISRPNI